MSISTLRRKIKSDTIEYKMEEGRYLIRSDDLADRSVSGFASSDEGASPHLPRARPASSESEPTPPSGATVTATHAEIPGRIVSAVELEMLREDFRRMQEDNLLRWKALDARVSGLAKKLEFFSEQMAEARMLVKIFEEKLDHRA
jgi:hypothetical protein